METGGVTGGDQAKPVAANGQRLEEVIGSGVKQVDLECPAGNLRGGVRGHGEERVEDQPRASHPSYLGPTSFQLVSGKVLGLVKVPFTRSAPFMNQTTVWPEKSLCQTRSGLPSES